MALAAFNVADAAITVGATFGYTDFFWQETD